MRDFFSKLINFSCRHDVLASDVPIDIGGLAAEGLRYVRGGGYGRE